MKRFESDTLIFCDNFEVCNTCIFQIVIRKVNSC